jgi:putative transposase
MGRTAKTATAEKSLPLPLQFLAAWIGMRLGEHQARVIEYQRAENTALLEPAGKAPAPTDGRRAPTASDAGQGTRPEGLATGGDDCNAGHHPEVVPRVGGGEVRRQQEARTGAASEGRGDRPAPTRDGEARHGMGLYEAARRADNLGYQIGRTTVERILREHGIEPAPERKRQYSWSTFINAHLGVIVGMDFFTVGGDGVGTGSVARAVRNRHRESDG